MESILTATTAIVVLVMATTGVAKKFFTEDNKWLPIINIVVGIFIGLLYAITIVKGDLAIYGWAGFISGLSAGGFYDLGANAKGLVNQNKSNKLIDDGLGYQDTQHENEGGE